MLAAIPWLIPGAIGVWAIVTGYLHLLDHTELRPAAVEGLLCAAVWLLTMLAATGFVDMVVRL